MTLPSCFSVARQGVEVGVRTSRSAARQDNNNSERPRPGNPNGLINGLLQTTSPARVGGGGGSDGGGGVSRSEDMGAVALLLLAASKASPRPSSDGREPIVPPIKLSTATWAGAGLTAADTRCSSGGGGNSSIHSTSAAALPATPFAVRSPPPAPDGYAPASSWGSCASHPGSQPFRINHYMPLKSFSASGGQEGNRGDGNVGGSSIGSSGGGSGGGSGSGGAGGGGSVGGGGGGGSVSGGGGGGGGGGGLPVGHDNRGSERHGFATEGYRNTTTTTSSNWPPVRGRADEFQPKTPPTWFSATAPVLREEEAQERSGDAPAGGSEAGWCHPRETAPACQTPGDRRGNDTGVTRPAWVQKQRRHKTQADDLPRGGRFNGGETPRFEQHRPLFSSTNRQLQASSLAPPRCDKAQSTPTNAPAAVTAAAAIIPHPGRRSSPSPPRAAGRKQPGCFRRESGSGGGGGGGGSVNRPLEGLVRKTTANARNGHWTTKSGAEDNAKRGSGISKPAGTRRGRRDGKASKGDVFGSVDGGGGDLASAPASSTGINFGGGSSGGAASGRERLAGRSSRGVELKSDVSHHRLQKKQRGVGYSKKKTSPKTSPFGGPDWRHTGEAEAEEEEEEQEKSGLGVDNGSKQLMGRGGEASASSSSRRLTIGGAAKSNSNLRPSKRRRPGPQKPFVDTKALPNSSGGGTSCSGGEGELLLPEPCEREGCTTLRPCGFCSKLAPDRDLPSPPKRGPGQAKDPKVISSRRPAAMDLDAAQSDTASAVAKSTTSAVRPTPRKKGKNLVWSQFRKACDRCTNKKVRCDGSNPTGGFKACTPCKRAGISCLFGICRRSGPRDAHGHKTAVAGVIMKRNDFEKVTERLGKCRTEACRFVNEDGSFWREHFHCRVGNCSFAGRTMSALLLHRGASHPEREETEGFPTTSGGALTSDVVTEASVTRKRAVC